MDVVCIDLAAQRVLEAQRAIPGKWLVDLLIRPCRSTLEQAGGGDIVAGWMPKILSGRKAQLHDEAGRVLHVEDQPVEFDLPDVEAKSREGETKADATPADASKNDDPPSWASKLIAGLDRLNDRMDALEAKASSGDDPDDDDDSDDESNGSQIFARKATSDLVKQGKLTPAEAEFANSAMAVLFDWDSEHGTKLAESFAEKLANAPAHGWFEERVTPTANVKADEGSPAAAKGSKKAGNLTLLDPSAQTEDLEHGGVGQERFAALLAATDLGRRFLEQQAKNS